MIWKSYGIADHFLFYKLGLKPWFYPRFLRRLSERLKDYDFISAHSFEGAIVAREAKRRFGIPFSITWHGSDIHTKPFKYPCIKAVTAALIAGAEINYFVSEALLKCSDALGPGNKKVLYNGVGRSFQKRSEVERLYLREKYAVRDKKVVAFIGNLFKIKQAELLPAIYANMKRKDLVFWVIGDGPLLGAIKEAEPEIRCFGSLPHDSLPELMNVIDLVILPSKVEGFGMVLAEALSSGCKAVGTLTGGIPEVIGEQNCVPLDDDPEAFCAAFSAKALQVLDSSGEADFDARRFDWARISEEEASFILQSAK